MSEIITKITTTTKKQDELLIIYNGDILDKVGINP